MGSSKMLQKEGVTCFWASSQGTAANRPQGGQVNKPLPTLGNFCAAGTGKCQSLTIWGRKACHQERLRWTEVLRPGTNPVLHSLKPPY